MRHANKTIATALALFLLAGCGAQLRHVGYSKTKVWYHWQDNMDHSHKLVVCDVSPNGSETNCKESEMIGGGE